MKKILATFALVAFSVAAMAQSTIIQKYMDKYEGNEDFTKVSLNGKMFSLFAQLEGARYLEAVHASQKARHGVAGHAGRHMGKKGLFGSHFLPHGRPMQGIHRLTGVMMRKQGTNPFTKVHQDSIEITVNTKASRLGTRSNGRYQRTRSPEFGCLCVGWKDCLPPPYPWISL